MSTVMHYISYLCISSFAGICYWLPQSILYSLAKGIGSIAYYAAPRFRKRTTSNLALASALQLTNAEIKKLSLSAFHNLMITLFEFGKLSRRSFIEKVVDHKSVSLANELIQKNTGIVFFCGHQANWEILFLDGILRFQKGMAIARPLKNPYICRWVQSIRETYGGEIIPQKQALRKGIRGLRSGLSIGIVGDQGMPESSFSSEFLGRTAWTSTAPALFAYKTNSPIVVMSIARVAKRYEIRYSDPIFPNTDAPLETEIPRLMNLTLSIFEKSILKNPDQWLWLHNRWKQETPAHLYYRFCMDSLLVILPRGKSFSTYNALLPLLEKIYPKAFLSLLVPSEVDISPYSSRWEVHKYADEKEILLEDYRFKLVFNFSGIQRIKKHFLRYSAFEVLSFPDLYAIAKKHEHLVHNKKYSESEILLRALCRPGTYWNRETDAS